MSRNECNIVFNIPHNAALVSKLATNVDYEGIEIYDGGEYEDGGLTLWPGYRFSGRNDETDGRFSDLQGVLEANEIPYTMIAKPSDAEDGWVWWGRTDEHGRYFTGSDLCSEADDPMIEIRLIRDAMREYKASGDASQAGFALEKIAGLLASSDPYYDWPIPEPENPGRFCRDCGEFIRDAEVEDFGRVVCAACDRDEEADEADGVVEDDDVRMANEPRIVTEREAFAVEDEPDDLWDEARSA